MTSAEYVSQVNRLMDLQNNYFNIFITILALTLGFLGILQWRITDKQIDKMIDFQNDIGIESTTT